MEAFKSPKTKLKQKYFGIYLTLVGKYIIIGNVAFRIEFPKDFKFTPEKWVFFCFSYNNENKSLVAYLDSKRIFDRIIKDHLDTFEIGRDFLNYEKFGDARYFVGNLTDINMWSSVLTEAEVIELFSCKAIDNIPDVVEWKFAEIALIISTPTPVTENGQNINTQ